MKKPPLLDTDEIIKSKTEMLNNLLEIEIAYSILKGDSKADSEADPLDIHYKKLHAEIEVLKLFLKCYFSLNPGFIVIYS